MKGNTGACQSGEEIEISGLKGQAIPRLGHSLVVSSE